MSVPVRVRRGASVVILAPLAALAVLGALFIVHTPARADRDPVDPRDAVRLVAPRLAAKGGHA